MKISLSNLAVGYLNAELLKKLPSVGVEGIEIAPTIVWPEWKGATGNNAKFFRAKLAEYDLSIPAIQSIFYGKVDLQFLGDPEDWKRFYDHFALVCEIAAELSATFIVFGSPKNRKNQEKITEDEIINRFFRLTQVASKHGVCLSLEPNPINYECNFITNYHQAYKYVKMIDSPHFRFHLDTACISLSGDDPVEVFRTVEAHIGHIHISEPYLRNLTKPLLNHPRFGKELRTFNGWGTIEMSKTGQADLLDSIEYIKKFYS